MPTPSQPPMMYVVAGPPGSGKSKAHPVSGSGYDFFNIDDRAAELNGGSYRAIPSEVRAQAQMECRAFIALHLAERTSFAVETTLRDGAANAQAREARARGFRTSMIFVATDDVEENLRRIIARGKAGGHCAPLEVLRHGYQASLSHLPEALAAFDRVALYDNTRAARPGHPARPMLVARIVGGKARIRRRPLPAWVRTALAAAGIKARA